MQIFCKKKIKTQNRAQRPTLKYEILFIIPHVFDYLKIEKQITRSVLVGVVDTLGFTWEETEPDKQWQPLHRMPYFE